MKSKATPSHPNNIIMYEKRKATHDIITYSYFVCIKKVNIPRMQCNHNKSELHPPTFTREIHFTQKYFFSLSISRKSTDDQEYHSDQKKNPTTFDYHTTDRTKTEQEREWTTKKKNIRNQNNDRIEYKYWYSLTLLLVFCVFFFLFLLPNVFWLLFFLLLLLSVFCLRWRNNEPKRHNTWCQVEEAKKKLKKQHRTTMSREFVLTVYIFFGWLPEFFVSSCFCFHFSRYGLWQAGFCCSSCMRCLYTFMYAEAAMVISCQRRAFGIWHHPVYGSRKCFFFLLSLYCFCCMDR